MAGGRVEEGEEGAKRGLMMICEVLVDRPRDAQSEGERNTRPEGAKNESEIPSLLDEDARVRRKMRSPFSGWIAMEIFKAVTACARFGRSSWALRVIGSPGWLG